MKQSFLFQIGANKEEKWEQVKGKTNGIIIATVYYFHDFSLGWLV